MRYPPSTRLTAHCRGASTPVTRAPPGVPNTSCCVSSGKTAAAIQFAPLTRETIQAVEVSPQLLDSLLWKIPKLIHFLHALPQVWNELPRTLYEIIMTGPTLERCDLCHSL